MRKRKGIVAALPLALLLHCALGGIIYGGSMLAAGAGRVGLPVFRAGDAGLAFTLVPGKEPETTAPEEADPAMAETANKPTAADPKPTQGDESGAQAVGVDGSVPLAPDGIPLAYPFGSRERGEEGTVTVRMLVDATGRARSVTVAASSGYFALDDAVVKAVQKARFKPALRDSRPRESETSLTVRFQLREGAP